MLPRSAAPKVPLRLHARVLSFVLSALFCRVVLCQMADEPSPASKSSSMMSKFADELPGPVLLVDASGVVLPEWESFTRYLFPPRVKVEGPASQETMLVVPDDLIAAVRTTCAEVLNASQQIVKNDQREPLLFVNASVIEGDMLAQLTDPHVSAFRRIDDRHNLWRCGFSGVAERDTSRNATIRVKRIVFIPPFGPDAAGLSEESFGVNARVVDETGRYRLPFIRLKVFGDEKFIRFCRLRAAIDEYLSRPADYSSRFLAAPAHEIADANERLRQAVTSVVDDARAKACDLQFLRAELGTLGLSESEAGDAARELTTKSGRRVLELLEETFKHSKDPLVSALRLMKYRGLFAKAVPPSVLAYASDTFATRFGVLLADDDSLCLCSASTVLQMHAQFLVCQGVLDDSLNIAGPSIAADTLDQVRQKVLGVAAMDFPSWPAASNLAAQLPQEPSLPAQPVDPYVRQAQLRRAAAVASKHADLQAAGRKRQEQLEHRMELAGARGDMEGYFEAGAALGAAAALQANNPQMAAQFGAAGREEAVEFARRQRDFTSSQNLPLEVVRPPDFESSPEWQQFMRETEAFPSKLAAYDAQKKERDAAVQRMANRLEPVLKEKQAAALAELDRMTAFRASQYRRAFAFIKSRGERILDAPTDDLGGWYIPLLDVLALRADALVVP